MGPVLCAKYLTSPDVFLHQEIASVLLRTLTDEGAKTEFYWRYCLSEAEPVLHTAVRALCSHNIPYRFLKWNTEQLSGESRRTMTEFSSYSLRHDSCSVFRNESGTSFSFYGDFRCFSTTAVTFGAVGPSAASWSSKALITGELSLKPCEHLVQMTSSGLRDLFQPRDALRS